MLNALVVGVATYMLTTLLGYVIHWALHQRWTGYLNKSHMAHHIRMYPPGDLVSNTYRSAGRHSTVYTFLLAFSPLLLLPFVLWLVGAWALATALVCVGAIAVVGLLNDFVHDSYHVRRHWLGRVTPSFYARLQHLHFVHHRDMRRNFGIYSFAWDRVFRTFRR